MEIKSSNPNQEFSKDYNPPTSSSYPALLDRNLAKKLMEIEGEIRGMDFKNEANFIIKERGKEGLKKVEEELKKVGYPLEYEKLETMKFYPCGLRALSLLAIKKALNFDDEKIRKMGSYTSKISFIVKIFIKYFSPISKFFFKETPKIWKKYWTIGEFIPVEYNKEKKYAIVRIKNLNLHPIYCLYLEGYFSTFTRLVTGGGEISVQETKCFFRGDEYHEYLLKWK